MAPRDRDRELDQELQDHLDLEAEDRAARGEDVDEASRHAHLTLGNVALIKEDTRASSSSWVAVQVQRLVSDVRQAGRLMRRSPFSTAAVVLSLALAIGANTAIFSVVHALMLRPLPVPHPESLVQFAIVSGEDQPFSHHDYPGFTQLRDKLSGLADTAAVTAIDRANVELAGLDPNPVLVSMVSGGYFPMLGIRPGTGRLIGPDDDRVPGAHPVAVISDEYWQRRLARATDVVGRTLKLNETTYSIIGVAPAGFTGDWIGHPVDIWMPTAMQSQVMVERPDLLTNPGPAWVRVVARLHDGVKISAAEAAADAWFHASRANQVPTRPVSPLEQQQMARAHGVLLPAGRGYSEERAIYGLPLTIAGAIVGIVLLIACTNVANLLLARAVARRAEMGLRLALGAGRSRLIRQLLTESSVLALSAGALGAALAAASMKLLGRVINSGEAAIALHLHMDVTLLGFTTVISLACGLLFGVAPAFTASDGSPVRALGGERGASRAGRLRLSRTLIVVQVALSVVLLVGAVLFAASLRNLRSQNLGFDGEHLLIAQVAPEGEGLSGAAIGSLMTRWQERLSAESGFISVAASSSGILSGGYGASPAVVPGYTYGPNEDNWVHWNICTPRYFETMGIPLMSGRDFTSADTTDAPRVAVVNATMARYYWGTTNVIGKRFGIRRDTGNEIEIIGVVNDARDESLRTTPRRSMYMPYLQDLRHLGPLTLVARTASSPAAFSTLIRERIREMDARLPVLSIRTANDQVEEALAIERLMALLSGAFGVLGLVLTCLGLFGVVSYLTMRRRSEIGVRLALGATRTDVIALVLGGSMRLVLAGIAIGVPAAVFTMRFASATLYGVSAGDVATLTAVSGVLALVAIAATSLPAYRATRVSPVDALRTE
jgi:predicted permease